MITLKYSKLRDPNFQHALYKLTNYAGFPTKACIAIAKLKKCIDSESVIAQEQFMMLLKKYAELDEKGNFVPKDNKPDTFVIIESKNEEWQKELKDFADYSFNIEVSKLALENVQEAKLSAQDYLALEEIFEEPVVDAVV